MDRNTIRPVLSWHNALVVGIANDQSIAYGCAKAFRTAPDTNPTIVIPAQAGIHATLRRFAAILVIRFGQYD